MLDASIVTVHDLFGGRIQFKIPVYQRHYVWNQDDQWEPLWQDILEKMEVNAQVEVDQDRNPHFIGTIVTRQLRRRVGAVPGYDIIDGQQRLTTFQIILCTICEVCYSAKLDDIAQQAEEFIFNSGLLRQRHDGNEFRDNDEKYKIIPTKVDKASFEALIDGEYDNIQGTIKVAYIYFKRTIEKYMKEYESEKPALQDFRGKMNHLLDTILLDFKVVEIGINAQANSERIFESINARGRTINEFDYLRNNIFLKARVSPRRNMDEEDYVQECYESHWQHLEDNYWTKLDETDEEMLVCERFLQHFLMAKCKKDSIVHRSLFYTYEKEYRATLAENQGVEFELSELEKYSKVYRVMRDCMYDSSERSDFHSSRRMKLIANRMEFYKYLKITSLHPFILFIVNKLEITFKELEKVFDILESYTMRRLLCSSRKNPSFSELFAKIQHSIGRTDSVSTELMGYLSTLESNEKCPNDDEVKRALSRCGEDRFDRSITRYILYRIALFKEASDSTLKNELRFSDQHPPTIEHVLPKSWDSNTKRESDLAIQSIGNLTLLTREKNEELGNQAFSEKREALLKNWDLKLTQEIVYESMDPIREREIWGVKEIRDREERLWKCFCNDLWPDVFLYSGKLKNWHPSFTQGFIIDEEGQEIPVASSEFQSLDLSTLNKGSKVKFKKVPTENGFKAVNVVKSM